MVQNLKLFILVVVLLVYASRWQAFGFTKQIDVDALKAVSAALGSSASVLKWKGNDPCGSSWTGITCHGSNVVQLKLYSLPLNGTLAPQIGNLSTLTSLEISYIPGLKGDLPPDLGRLEQLTTLSLQQCSFTGSIPGDLSKLQNLNFLALNGNQLRGQIPSVLGRLSQLYWFDISDNFITGPLPVSTTSGDNVGLDNLTAAGHFHMNNNNLNGQIPGEIFSLPNLLHLLLDSNEFGGELPRAVENAATSLLILKLDNNALVGTIPGEVAKMSQLKELYLSNNGLNGPIPSMLGLSNLQLLDLSSNPFQAQTIPSWLPQLMGLQTLKMAKSSLYGNVPSDLFDLPEVTSIVLSSNMLNGTITFDSKLASSLVSVNLELNNITSLAGPSSQISELLLAGNPVCTNNAFVPATPGICQLSNETVGAAWTADPSSSCNKTCDSEKTLNPALCSCAFPLICQLQLTAPTFEIIDDSRITNIETEFATQLSLNPKQIWIGSANFNDEGRLLFNTLFFPDPELGSLSDANISRIISALSVNARPLSGIKLTEGPFLLLNSTLPPLENASKHSISGGVIAGILVGALLVAITVFGIIVYAIRQKRRADRAEVMSKPFASWGAASGDSGDAPKLKGARWFSYADLKKITNNFNESNEIGVGGYGKVYKGVLSSGEVVAVKRAQEGSMQGATEFKNEIEILSRVHHRHLVGLIGFCYEQGEQMLVYEYMPNGTLRDHLLGSFEFPLSWQRRMSIAVGSARGLAYLHEMANPPIIHRDIKSSNILLDEKLVAKVADFGLSKLAPNGGDKSHVSTQVKGTLGYLDPEYYMTQQLSEKSDVYSFGVVLLELITARQPIERGRYIVREVRIALDKDGMNAFRQMLDPNLGNYPPDDLEAVLDLALHCVEETGDGRPTMNEVVKELEAISGSSYPNSGVARNSHSNSSV